MNSFTILIVSCIIVYVKAQQYGPVPQRPQYLGASLVQSPRPINRQRQINLRPELTQQDQIQQSRVRRPPPQQLPRRPQFPQAQIFEQQRNVIEDGPVPYKTKLTGPTPSPIYQQQTTKNLTPRPVTEEESDEDEEESATTATTPSTTIFPTSFRPNYIQPIQLNQSPISFQKSQFNQPTAFRPSPQIPQPIAPPQAASLQGRQLIRPQGRPAPPPQLQITRPSPQPIRNQQEEEDEEDEEPQYFRQPPSRIQQKKQPETVRQQIIDQDQLRPQQLVRQPQRQQFQPAPQPQRQEYQRPVVQREPHVKASNVQKEKKPVVQTIRKFHEENEDGSITWGYENDDGTFKEETIGVDCVTRGKYGYVDPDGVKREYTYQTGIPCDKEQQEAEEAASNNEGFIDYTNNKYVFPNGDEIDLEAMVKNRARKPVQRYRN